jgi:hypothetical protein
MRIYTLLALLLGLWIPLKPAFAATIQTQHITQTALSTVESSLNTAFVAEGRIGNNASNGTHELALGKDTSSPFATGQVVWVNGASSQFIITYDPKAGANQKLAFSIAGKTLYFDPVGQFDDLYLRAKGTTTATMKLDSLQLKTGNDISFSAVNDSAYSLTGSGGIDVLQIYNISSALSTGFTLKGYATLFWSGSTPSNSQLAFQVKGIASAPEPGSVAIAVGFGMTALLIFAKRRWIFR